ncbi:uncharacterized protein LOC117558919 [Gymnodraco acuticeps]|uniref:Uncharacterized protein LOC117558919 n=1 Tax=Gymnodraco acuticeps TaxID=8218 RepID=A0A6P8VZF1_GYMAC|nr:uncharacterized protein LOC117558919 [Gymnodraco acuticeps]
MNVNVNAENMHITIREGRSLPDLQRCTTCCNDFHCPFCVSRLFSPTKHCKVKSHLESHFQRAVLHEGYTIHRCGLNCRPDYHFHCCYCQSMHTRKSGFVKHLALCKAKHSAITPIIPDPAIPIIPDPSTPVIPDPAIPIIPVRKMQRVRVEPVLKKKCPICHVLMNNFFLKRHMERKHSAKQKDITASSHLPSECIDPEHGVYAVHKAFHGTSIPLHVQNKVWGENQHVSCENNECQVNLELAWRSGIKAYQCTHLKSITYCSSYASPIELDEDILTEMVNNKWFGEDKKSLCLVRQNLAKCNHVPLSVYSKTGTPKTTKYVSSICWREPFSQYSECHDQRGNSRPRLTPSEESADPAIKINKNVF